MSTAPALLVVQPSADYARRITHHFPDAVLLATAGRADELRWHPRVVGADLERADNALAAVRSWCAGGGELGGIVCFVCEYLPLTADLAEPLGLPFHAPQTVRLTRHKELAAERWQRSGVPTPAGRLVHTVADAVAFAADYPPPWVLKPSDGSGSEWVLRTDTLDQLVAAHGRIIAGLQRGDGDGAPTCLVQALVSGREFGADLYVSRSGVRLLRVTEKVLASEPGVAGVVTAYFVPDLDAATRAALQDAIARGAAALGIRRGVAMVDVILDGGTPYLLEMALRPGGDCLPDLCISALGYDPVRTACRVAMGGEPEPDRPAGRERLAALHLLSRRSGLVRRVDCDRLLRHPQVVRLIEVYHGPGEELRCWEGSYDDRILAAVLVRYDDVAQLPALSASLTDLVDVELESPPPAEE